MYPHTRLSACNPTHLFSESFQDKMSLLVWVEQCTALNLDELRASTQSKLDVIRNQSAGPGAPEPQPLPMRILPGSFVERAAPRYVAEMWRTSGETTACMQFCE